MEPQNCSFQSVRITVNIVSGTGIYEESVSMTNFLKDPIYLEYMNTECAKTLARAQEALRNNDAASVRSALDEAKMYFEPSEFYKKNLLEIQRLENAITAL